MAAYRSAAATDGESVIQLLSRAYGREEGSAKLDRDRAAFLAHPGDYRVLERDGEIVSALHCLRDGKLTREPADLPELELPQDLFCFLLLGLQPVHHVVRQLPHPPTRAETALLNALFPPQPTATGVWG